MNMMAALRHDPPAPTDDSAGLSLSAFLRDEATRNALASALDERAAPGSVASGNIHDAIERFAHEPSPRWLIVDLGGVIEPMAELDKLAEVCDRGTTVIAVGEVNDVSLYRMIIEAGVADYLVKPVTPETFRACFRVARRSERKPERSKPEAHGRVLVVTGARGGVGATTAASTLAWLFAEERGKRTMLVDLDLHWGAAALALDVEAGHGLCEALESPDRIDSLFMASAATSVADNLYLLSSEEPFEHPTAIRIGAIARLSTELRQDFEYVVIDLPRSGPELLQHSFLQADEILIMSDLSLAGLRDTTRLIALAKSAAPSAKLVVAASRAGAPRRNEVPRAEFEKAIGAPLAAVIPDDAAAAAAMNTGKPLAKAAPGCKAIAALRELASHFGEQMPAEKPGLLAGLLRGLKLGGR